MDDPWGPFYERIGRVMQNHGPAIREAASRGRLHLADTTIDEIFNLEDHLHELRRRNETMESSARQEPRMDDTFDSVNDQIDHSNSPALTSHSSSDSLKTIRINQRHVQDDLNCTICLEQFQLGLEVQETPCKHLYHRDCIIPWLTQHNSCPICRFDMHPRLTLRRYASSFPIQRSRPSLLYYLTFVPNLTIIIAVLSWHSINALRDW